MVIRMCTLTRRGPMYPSVVVMSEELKPDVLVSTGICQMMMAS